MCWTATLEYVPWLGGLKLTKLELFSRHLAQLKLAQVGSAIVDDLLWPHGMSPSQGLTNQDVIYILVGVGPVVVSLSSVLSRMVGEFFNT